MHSISSRWRKPVSNKAKKKAAAIANAKKRWQKEPSANVSCSMPQPATSPVAVMDFPPELVTTASTSYTLMDDTMWSTLLQNVPCKECHFMCLSVSKKSTFGLASNLELLCSQCGHNYGSTFASNRNESSRSFAVNSKAVQAFLSIGKGQAALDTFAMILGLPTMDPKTFANHMDYLALQYNSVKEDVLSKSRDIVRQHYADICSGCTSSEDIINISVSYDGTWQKRGHTSLYGIGIVIEVLTGLVVDYEILTISDFNLGCKKSMEIISSAKNEIISDASFAIASKKDQKRNTQKKKRSTLEFKVQRKCKKVKKTVKNKQLQKLEGKTYGSGLF
ncbi:hypothetical protein JTE90_025758 [Oedothorax gibbosus]|uniref:Mutator-like transposase domain-containing protein n=1 Tax=Oedothorax gibbosus TaxID=931172 RepID=A0AAV6U7D9_9ARAC|nr:hypothetical protein JTE90_025758 [Oedothorax gibbosus]